MPLTFSSVVTGNKTTFCIARLKRPSNATDTTHSNHCNFPLPCVSKEFQNKLSVIYTFTFLMGCILVTLFIDGPHVSQAISILKCRYFCGSMIIMGRMKDGFPGWRDTGK